jgi:hypothetical protein
MKTLLALILITVACADAQQSLKAFEGEYAQGLHQNPAGITFVISTADGHTTYHLHDTIPIKLALASKNPHVYTFETTSGLTTEAGGSDDLVIFGPDVVSPIHSRSRVMQGHYVCCESKRIYLTEEAAVASFSTTLGRILRLMPKPDMTTGTEITPGEYTVFMQTRRVLRGSPKSQDQNFRGVSNIVVTSNNVLHLTLVADTPNP